MAPNRGVKTCKIKSKSSAKDKYKKLSSCNKPCPNIWDVLYLLLRFQQKSLFKKVMWLKSTSFKANVYFAMIVIRPQKSLAGGLKVCTGATDGCFQAAGLRGELLHPSPAPRSRSRLTGRFVSSSSVKLLLSSSSSSVSSKNISPKPYSCAWTDTSFGIKWGEPSTKSANLLEWKFDVSNRDVNRTAKISSLWVR